MSTWYTQDPPEEGLYRVFEEIRDESRGVVMFRETTCVWEGRWVCGGYVAVRGWREWPERVCDNSAPDASESAR